MCDVDGTELKLPIRYNIGLQDGHCNLKCPMCYVHGHNKEQRIVVGQMPIDKACKLFDEISIVNPTINPTLWAETFLVKEFETYVQSMKSRGFKIVINTNGLLLTDKLAEFLVHSDIDGTFISIDAVSEDVFFKVRGIRELDHIKAAVFRLLDARGDKRHPRIGVSFVINSHNREEVDEFIEYWLQYVDVVRVNDEYTQNCPDSSKISEKRIPCSMLYETMAIMHNGDVPICCLDSACNYLMGNVFVSGVKGVWNGDRFKQVRKYHEMGMYDKLDICKNCNVWSIAITEEIITDELMIRKSPLSTFYNRLDRMFTLNSEYLGTKPASYKT